MTNNKRIQIQHWYTTGNAAPSGTGLTNMLLGEIAIATQTGKEAIFIKNNDGSAVTFMTSAQTNDLITQKLGDAGIGTDDVISTLSQNLGTLTQKLDTHIKAPAELNKSGHVMLVSGDVKSETYANGYAAAASHTHGQYLTGVTAGSGLAIAGIIENGDVKLQLDSETDNKINSGVTAYDWGNHAEYDYATNTSLNDHSGNTEIHVTKTKQDAWDNASSAITAFLKDANLTGNAVDTLIEIQQFLDGTGSTVQTLLKTLDDLTETVSGNTTAINQNSNNISSLATSASTNASNITTINNAIGDGFDSGNTIATNISGLKSSMIISGEGGNNISVNVNPIGSSKKLTIMHTGATQEVAYKTLTGTTTTALTWGDTFTIPTKISHDANGHYVSGTTSIFTMPTLPYGELGEENKTYGIVRLKGGDLNGLNGYVTDSREAKSTAAHYKHTHSQYATTTSVNTTLNDYIKFSDLGANTGDVIVISCGTY